MRNQFKTKMNNRIRDTAYCFPPTALAAVVTVIGTLSLAANEPFPPSASGTPSGSDRVLPRSAMVPLDVVDRLFPEVTREAATGQNSAAVGKPKATRSVIYGNNDGSKKVTISVDKYATSSEASSAYEAAVQKSKVVPGFKPLPATNLGSHAFIGTVTQAGETHIGVGALDGTLIVGATLAGYEPTHANVAKVMELTRRQQETAKAALDRFDRN